MVPFLFVVFLLVLIAGTVIPYLLGYAHGTMLPMLISSQGHEIDHEIKSTMLVVGIFFVTAQLVLAYLIVRYRDRGQKAVYAPSRGAVWAVALIPIIFVVTEIFSSMTNQRVWAELHINDADKAAVPVEVTGMQFKWYFRYPGKDGIFGLRKATLVDDASQNFLGVDYDEDKYAKDDVVTASLKVPWDRTTLFHVRSRDVIHSFFVREMRVKQDAVPGLEVKVPIKILKEGLFVFTADGVDPAALDADKAPAALRASFEAHGIKTDDACEFETIKTPSKRWSLTTRVQSLYDPEKAYPVKYAILLEQGKVNVYRTTYEVFCAELCGQGHYGMRAEMEVVPPDEFDAWVRAESEKCASYH